MSKVITDENQLNTEVDDLITEDYALEVLGLKNPADFRKFSRSFMKLSKIVKGIDDSNVGKLDKGAVSSEYDTAKKIEDKIKNIISNENKIKYQNLESGSDLNDIFTAGYYRCSYDGTVIKNTPDSNTSAFILIVHRIQDNEQYGQQILYYYNSPNIYIREANNTWGLWTKIATSKDIVPIKETINNINESLHNIKAKQIGSTDIELDILKESIKLKPGFYVSNSAFNKWKNTPNNLSAFELTITGIEYNDSYRTLLLKEYSSNKYYIRTQTSYGVGDSGHTASWSEWSEIVQTDSKLFLGSLGVYNVEYIQDNINKNEHLGYFDINTGRLYRAKNTTSDTSVSNNFEPADNISLSKMLASKIIFNEPDKALELINKTGYGRQIINIKIDKNFKYLNIYGSNVGFIKIPVDIFNTPFSNKILFFDNSLNEDLHLSISFDGSTLTIENIGKHSDSVSNQSMYIYRCTLTNI